MKNDQKPGVIRRTVTFIGTLAVIALAGGAVAVGTEALSTRADNAPKGAVAELASVAVRPIQFDGHYTTTRQFLGQVEAGADAVLSFELGGQLAELTLEEGDPVFKGTVIARLGTELLEAEQRRLEASRKATAAQLTFAETRLKRATDLRAEGFSSQETLDQARATRDELLSRIEEVEAGLMTVKINLEKSVLIAPFDGRVGVKNVEVPETLSAGQPILTLIETSAPIVRVGLPLSFSTQDLQNVNVAINGVAYPATLKQLRPDIDPVTRTRTALFSVAMGDVPAFGQTATLQVVAQVAARGTWVPFDALQQGSGSIWSARVVEDNVVRTADVEVLYTESDRAYVRGSFAEGALLIETGAHRIVPGQRVNVLLSGEDAV
ncbi:MAG: efflux RND transporter periplasmic adaptor subunit [Pseudomonadota bacterium]